MLLKLRQTLCLTGNLLQITAANPYPVAIFAADLAVVAAGFQQLDFLAGREAADDTVAVGWAAAHVGGERVADPTISGRLLGLGWCDDG